MNRQGLSSIDKLDENFAAFAPLSTAFVDKTAFNTTPPDRLDLHHYPVTLTEMQGRRKFPSFADALLKATLWRVLLFVVEKSFAGVRVNGVDSMDL